VSSESQSSSQPPPSAAPEVVLCPVRGGKRSGKTVERAVALAVEGPARLVFLYIVDVDFLGYATVARVKLMVDELIETGSFALEVLADKARAAGVTEVETVIHQGSIRTVIRQAIVDHGATVLVTGRPGQTPGIVSFSAAEFDALLQELTADTGVRIERVE